MIRINASGMIGGRGIGDGITIFGNNPNNQGEEGSNMNTGVSSLKPDFILNLKEKYNYPFIFIIYFEKETKSYFIRPYSSKNNDNRILYIKLTNGYNLPLKQKEIISAGNIIFQVSPLENNVLEVVNLSKQNLSNMLSTKINMIETKNPNEIPKSSLVYDFCKSLEELYVKKWFLLE